MPNTLRLAIYERDEWCCRYCGIGPLRLRGEGSPMATIDHVVPKTRGGSGKDPANLVSCCNSCNHRKADLSLAECGMVLMECPNEEITWTPPTTVGTPRKRKPKQEIHPFIVRSLSEAMSGSLTADSGSIRR